MNRRNFLKNLFASSAAVVVAPATALTLLDEEPERTYVDMGKNLSLYGQWRDPGCYMVDVESYGMTEDGHFMVMILSNGEKHRRFIGRPGGLALPNKQPIDIFGPSGLWSLAR